MPNTSWKSAERRVARMLGSERVAFSGSAPFGKKGDVNLIGYVIDVKSGRNQIPKSVEHWLEAIRALAAERSEIPVLVLQPYRRKEQLVIMLLGDFARIREAERKVLETRKPSPRRRTRPPEAKTPTAEDAGTHVSTDPGLHQSKSVAALKASGAPIYGQAEWEQSKKQFGNRERNYFKEHPAKEGDR